MENLCLRMVIMSHLSDVQEMVNVSPEKIRMRVNFVKILVQKLDKGVKEMSEDELNEEWKKCNERFGGK
jgi:hypothetical protein